MEGLGEVTPGACAQKGVTNLFVLQSSLTDVLVSWAVITFYRASVVFIRSSVVGF